MKTAKRPHGLNNVRAQANPQMKNLIVDTVSFHNLYLLTRPDRWIRPLILWSLGGGFFEPFCHTYIRLRLDGERS